MSIRNKLSKIMIKNLKEGICKDCEKEYCKIPSRNGVMIMSWCKDYR